MAQRGHGKSLSERLCFSLVWNNLKMRKRSLVKWGLLQSEGGKKKRKRGITQSGCDLSKARRRPRPQWRGRGDLKIDSTSVAGFPTVLPSIWSFISMLCWAHPMLLCMQGRFCTRPQISRACKPHRTPGEEEYTYRETSLSVIWLGTFFSELCVHKDEVIFFPMHAAQAGRKKRIWFGPAWCCRVIYQPNASLPLGFSVNISRLFYSEVLASWLWK